MLQKDMIIAREYAKAAFDFSIENNSLENWKDMLHAFWGVCKQNILKNFIYGIYSSKILLQIFIMCCKIPVDVYGKNFIKLLIVNNRLMLMKDILFFFMEFYNHFHNIINIELITPYTLKVCDINKINAILSNRLNKKVFLLCKKKSSILDGVIIRYRDIIINDCFLNSFKELSNFLLFRERK